MLQSGHLAPSETYYIKKSGSKKKAPLQNINTSNTFYITITNNGNGKQKLQCSIIFCLAKQKRLNKKLVDYVINCYLQKLYLLPFKQKPKEETWWKSS